MKRMLTKVPLLLLIHKLRQRIIKLFYTIKFTKHLKIDTLYEIDSEVYCFSCCKDLFEKGLLKIIYADSNRLNVYILNKLETYLNKNGWTGLKYCMADGPDGTSSAYLKGNIILFYLGEWDGGIDSDTTYVPSNEIKLTFYLLKSNNLAALLSELHNNIQY